MRQHQRLDFSDIQSIEIISILQKPKLDLIQQHTLKQFLINTTNLLSSLNYQYILSQMKLLSLSKGETLVSQLETVHHYYVLIYGQINSFHPTTTLPNIQILQKGYWPYSLIIHSSKCYILSILLPEFATSSQFNIQTVPNLQQLQQIKFINLFNSTHLKQIQQQMQLQYYSFDSLIYQQADAALNVYFILEGQFELTQKIKTQNNRSIRLAILNQNELFGHEEFEFNNQVMENVTPKRRIFTVKCISDSGLLASIQIEQFVEKIFNLLPKEQKNEYINQLKNTLKWRKELIKQQLKALNSFENKEGQQKVPIVEGKGRHHQYIAQFLNDSEDNAITFLENYSVQKKDFRKRIVSVQDRMQLQPSQVNKNKRNVYKKFKNKKTNQVFVAVEIKPNLALLRNKGFYELQKAEELFNVQKKKDLRKQPIILNDSNEVNYYSSRNSKTDVVKLSQQIANRSSKRILPSSSLDDKSQQQIPKQGGNQILKLLNVITGNSIQQSTRNDPIIQENYSIKHYNYPKNFLNKNFYKNMKKKFKSVKTKFPKIKVSDSSQTDVQQPIEDDF